MNNTRFRSLSTKITALIAVLMLLLLSILIASNLYSISLLRSQIVSHNTNLLELYFNRLDSELGSASDYLLQTGINETVTLDVKNNNDRYFAKRRIVQLLQTALKFHDRLDGLFLYDNEDGSFIYAFNEQTVGTDYNNRAEFQTHFMDKVNQESAFSWQTISIGDYDYLINIVPVGHYIMGSWLMLSSILHDIESLEIENVVNIALLADDIHLKKEHIESRDNQNPLQSSVSSKKMNLSAIVSFSDPDIMEGLGSIQLFIIIFSIVAIGGIPFAFFYLRRIVMQPISKMKYAIGELRKGNWDYRIDTGNSSSEFKLMEEAYNDLIVEVKELRIDIYEEKILHQEAELQFLQAQIKPHFFLNLINNFSNLANMQDYSSILRLSKYMSDYVRYTFKSVNGIASINEEINHVQKYIKLQQMRYPFAIHLDVEVAPQLFDFRIPSLLIQTFVENCVKHVKDVLGELHITIRAEQNNKDQILITICDNGKGFSNTALDDINQDRKPESGSIGIWNAKRRLFLLYSEDGKVSAENANGAVVKIFLPDSRQTK